MKQAQTDQAFTEKYPDCCKGSNSAGSFFLRGMPGKLTAENDHVE
jgi:hypothetical protein